MAEQPPRLGGVEPQEIDRLAQFEDRVGQGLAGLAQAQREDFVGVGLEGSGGGIEQPRAVFAADCVPAGLGRGGAVGGEIYVVGGGIEAKADEDFEFVRRADFSA